MKYRFLFNADTTAPAAIQWRGNYYDVEQLMQAAEAAKILENERVKARSGEE